MSEGFLSRWSRRKQAAAQAPEPAKSPPHSESAAAPEPAAGSSRAPESRDPSGVSQPAPDVSRDSGAAAFDPASLPPIESITAETDIRAFFAAGVPAELTRAALRRVWTSDPKIRDFVGLADYAWDFNAPGSMAGFGPLEAADGLRAQMAPRLDPVTARDGAAEMSDHDPGAKPALASDASVHDRPNQPTTIVSENERSPEIDASQVRDELMQPEREPTAAQPQHEKPEDAQSTARRRHGRALPET